MCPDRVPVEARVCVTEEADGDTTAVGPRGFSLDLGGERWKCPQRADPAGVRDAAGAGPPGLTGTTVCCRVTDVFQATFLPGVV